LLTFVLDSAII